jgi:prepilin-type N-terminal cleavage/methylation domain-containing protein
MGHREHGFTLIELVVVLGLSSLLLVGLAAVGDWGTGTARGSRRYQRLTEASHMRTRIQTIVDRMRALVAVDGTLITFVDDSGHLRALDLRRLLTTLSPSDPGLAAGLEVEIVDLRDLQAGGHSDSYGQIALLRVILARPDSGRVLRPELEIERTIRLTPTFRGGDMP